MRREGRLHGYEISKELMIRVKTSNKPTNCSKVTGRCGRAKCRHCHWYPVNKSMKKIKGQHKANGFDVKSNHLMHDWRLDKHHMKAVDWLGDHDIDEDQDEMQESFGRWMQGYYVYDAGEKLKEAGWEEDGERTPEEGVELVVPVVPVVDEEQIKRERVDSSGDEAEERSLSDWLEVACEGESSSSDEDGEEDWYLC